MRPETAYTDPMAAQRNQTAVQTHNKITWVCFFSTGLVGLLWCFLWTAWHPALHVESYRDMLNRCEAATDIDFTVARADVGAGGYSLYLGQVGQVLLTIVRSVCM